jgi:hypothetical protein
MHMPIYFNDIEMFYNRSGATRQLHASFPERSNSAIFSSPRVCMKSGAIQAASTLPPE